MRQCCSDLKTRRAYSGRVQLQDLFGCRSSTYPVILRRRRQSVLFVISLMIHTQPVATPPRIRFHIRFVQNPFSCFYYHCKGTGKGKKGNKKKKKKKKKKKLPCLLASFSG